MSIMNKKFMSAALGAASVMASSAYALTTPKTASVAFAEPFTVTETQAVNFGLLAAGIADTYVLDTADGITASGSGVIFGGEFSGQFDIAEAGDPGSVFDIEIGNFATGGAKTTVTLSAPKCVWEGSPETDCGVGDGFTSGAPAGSAGGTLSVGMSATTDGTETDGDTSAPTFDIILAY